MDTEAELARSQGVAAIAAEALGDPDAASTITVASSPSTTILEISSTSESPIRAQESADAFAAAYLQYKREQAVANLQALRGPLETQIKSLQKQLSELNRAIGLDLPTAQQQSTRDELTGQIAILQSQLGPLSAIVIDPGTVIQPAVLPSAPASPNHPTNAAMALFGGLMLGAITALVRERLDDGLRGRSDLESQSGAPVLAVIPKVPTWKKRDEVRLATVSEPKGAASESYRTLRTSMLFAAAQRGIKVVLVASATAGEGKTTTAANLSVVLANADKRVILVNADLRKPRVHKFFQVENRMGVVDVLAGEVKPWEALVDPGIENLRVFPGGPIPTRPAELLGSEAMGESSGSPPGGRLHHHRLGAGARRLRRAARWPRSSTA